MTKKEVLIVSTGTVNGISAKAGMILNKLGIGGNSPVFKFAIAATDKIYLEGNLDVTGDIAAANVIDLNGKALDLHGHNSICPAVIDAPPIEFPAEPPYTPTDPTDDLIYTGASSRTLDIAATADQIVIYDKLSMANGTLVITTGNAGNVVRLVVNVLDLQNGTVKLTGSGRLQLFVKINATFKSDTNYNDPNPSIPSQLIVFLGDGCSAYLDANDIFNGFIYGPGANVTVKGTNGFTGAILGRSVTCGGNPFINYDPTGAAGITFDTMPVYYFTRGKWFKP